MDGEVWMGGFLMGVFWMEVFWIGSDVCVCLGGGLGWKGLDREFSMGGF